MELGFNKEKKKGSQMRITEEEIELIKRTYKDNEKLLKLLRKTFLPELDPYAPLNQNIDLWMTVPVEQLMKDEAAIHVMARNQLIRHVESCLIQLDILANTEAKTPEEIKEQLKKNSAK